MGCGSCGTGGCGSKSSSGGTATAGCGSKGCATGGCNKLNTFDWLGNMLPPGQTEADNIYEIRFKNTRKQFYKNVSNLNLITGDFVAVESDRGFDVGQISLGGVLARLQMKKKGVKDKPDQVKKIYRRATKDDMDKLRLARGREQHVLERTRLIIQDLKLDMKCSDVEFQGDNTKAIFYYIAEQRVDFRLLLKHLANEFHIRVEMKQIGLRHESGLVGAIGSCGRELCCSTWLTEFRNVSTSAARYQNLSLNPMKISGQCGRLKCCLNFELESYMDALKFIPNDVKVIETEQGRAFLQKTDIFKQTMWFAYAQEGNWTAVPVNVVKEMKAMNEKGLRPVSLHSIDGTEPKPSEEEMDFVDVVGQSKLREFGRARQKNIDRPRTDRRDTPRVQPPATEGGEGSQTDQPSSEGQERREQQPRDRENRDRRRDDRRPPRQEGQQQPRREGGPQNQQPRREGGDRNRGDRRDNRRDNRNRPPRNQGGGENPSTPPPSPPPAE